MRLPLEFPVGYRRPGLKQPRGPASRQAEMMMRQGKVAAADCAETPHSQSQEESVEVMITGECDEEGGEREAPTIQEEEGKMLTAAGLMTGKLSLSLLCQPGGGWVGLGPPISFLGPPKKKWKK